MAFIHTQEITERGIVVATYLDVKTEADLLLLTDMADGDKAKTSGKITATDGLGADWVYNSSKSLINNTGTILNGWVRQYDGPVLADWFDDWQDAFALQESVTFTKRKTYLLNREINLFSNTVIDFKNALIEKDPTTINLVRMFKFSQGIMENTNIKNGNFSGHHFDGDSIRVLAGFEVINTSNLKNSNFYNLEFTDIANPIKGNANEGFAFDDCKVKKVKQVSTITHTAPTIPTKYLYALFNASPVNNVVLDDVENAHCFHLALCDQSYGTQVESYDFTVKNSRGYDSINSMYYSYANRTTYENNMSVRSGKDAMKTNLGHSTNNTNCDDAIIKYNTIIDGSGNYTLDSSGAIQVGGNYNTIIGNKIIWTRDYLASVSEVHSIICFGGQNKVSNNYVTKLQGITKKINGVSLIDSLTIQPDSSKKKYGDVVTNNELLAHEDIADGASAVMLQGTNRVGAVIDNNKIKFPTALQWLLAGKVNSSMSFKGNEVTGTRNSFLFNTEDVIGIDFSNNTISGLRARTISANFRMSYIGVGNIIKGVETSPSTSFQLSPYGSYHKSSPDCGVFNLGQVVHGATRREVTEAGMINPDYPTVLATGTSGSRNISFDVVGVYKNDIVDIAGSTAIHYVTKLSEDGLSAELDTPLSANVTNGAVTPHAPTFV